MILHADMDAFYAAVEQRDQPALRGRPVIVGGTSDRGVVSAASYEARVYGVRSAMPTAQARALCPRGVFLAGEMAKYRAESRRLFEIFARFSPRVEALSLDEAFLDLAGCERLLGPPPQVAEALRRAVREEAGLAVSCGIAPVKLVAKIASGLAKPDGCRSVSEAEVRAFLEPLPVAQLWGVGPVLERRLRGLGIHTLGALAAWPELRLRAALGDAGPRLAALARGEDARVVEPERRARSLGEEHTFADDVRDPERLRRALRGHAEAVARRLRRAGLRARGLTIKVKLAQPLGGGRFPLLTRSRQLGAPSDDGGALARVAEELLAQLALREPVRLIGLSARELEAADARQLSLFEGAAERQRARVNEVVDRIHERFGHGVLTRGGGEITRAGLTSRVKAGEEPT